MAHLASALDLDPFSTISVAPASKSDSRPSLWEFPNPIASSLQVLSQRAWLKLVNGELLLIDNRGWSCCQTIGNDWLILCKDCRDMLKGQNQEND
jgi:hypothetical protein